MMMTSYNSFFILIIAITAMGMHAQTLRVFTICSDTKTPTTRDIKCYEDKVINIMRATISRPSRSHSCTPVSGSGCWYNLVTATLKCTGYRTCTVSTEIPGLSFDPTCGERRILSIKYACDTYVNAVWGYNNETRIGKTVDLISPGFPCDIPERIKSLHCTIKPFNTTGYIYVRIFAKLLAVAPGVGDCQEQLTFWEIGDTYYTYHRCNEDDVYELRNTHLKSSARTDLEFRYKKHESGDHGGKFWTTLSANSEIIVNCNREDHDEDVDVDDPGAQPESCVPFLTTTSVPSMRTTTPADTKEEVDDDQENNSCNDSMIIGLAALSVILAAVVAGLVAYIAFTKYKNKQNETGNDRTNEPSDDQDKMEKSEDSCGVYLEIMDDGVDITKPDTATADPVDKIPPAGDGYLEPIGGIKDNGYPNEGNDMDDANLEMDKVTEHKEDMETAAEKGPYEDDNEVEAKMYTLTDDAKLKRASII